MNQPGNGWPHPWLPLLQDPPGPDLILRDRHVEIVPRPVATQVRAATTDAAAQLTAHQGHVLQLGQLLVAQDDWLAAHERGGPALARALLSRCAVAASDAARVLHRADAIALLSGPQYLVDPLECALQDSGIESTRRRHGAHHTRPTLVVHCGRPSPTRIQTWMNEATPHLVVVPRAASIRVGPLVDPGASACLRCLHLARTDRWAAWATVSEQIRLSRAPEPDPVLVHQAVGTAVRGVAEFFETGAGPLVGQYRTATWDDAAGAVHTVARHPECGCWWPRAPEATTATALLPAGTSADALGR